MSYDEAEFLKIHQEFQPRVHRYLSQLVGESEAEDLTQDVFIKIHRSLENFRGESKLSTWLYRIATNTALDRMRSPSFRRIVQENKLDTSIDEVASDSDDIDTWSGEKISMIEQQYVRNEMNECIRAFIEELPENYRTVLLLSELEGFKNKEVAEILGLSLSTVKIRLHRARGKLKQELEAHCESYWIEENEYLPDLKHALKAYRNHD